MTDLEMTWLCAAAMGAASDGRSWHFPDADPGDADYYPLTDDAQAMALDGYLLERGWLGLFPEGLTLTDTRGRDIVHFKGDMHDPANRRRARVECVAKLQQAKGGK